MDFVLYNAAVERDMEGFKRWENYLWASGYLMIVRLLDLDLLLLFSVCSLYVISRIMPW
jgi:hypothetical protein